MIPSEWCILLEILQWGIDSWDTLFKCLCPRERFVRLRIIYKSEQTNSKIAAFSQLQQKIFPVYFGLQTGLPVLLALTYPAVRGLSSPASGLQGILDVANRWSVLVPVATMFITGLVNVVYVGPATTKVMRERKHQGKSYSRLLWRWLGLTSAFSRNQRWQKVIWSCTSLRGDAAVEQEVWYYPWDIILDKFGWYVTLLMVNFRLLESSSSRGIERSPLVPWWTSSYPFTSSWWTSTDYALRIYLNCMVWILSCWEISVDSSFLVILYILIYCIS